MIKLALVLVSLTLSLSANAEVYQLPGINPSDPTDFGQVFLTDVKASYKLKKTGSTLKATQEKKSFDLWVAGTRYDVTKGTYSLTAQFDSSGNLIDGFVEIKGAVEGLDVNKKGVLATMSLTEFAYTEDLIGFNTADLECPSFDFCTDTESVYLTGFEDGFDFDAKKWSSSADAITTIPLPAAAWLFGSALLGLGAMKRKKA
jgi:hypothetical protein